MTAFIFLGDMLVMAFMVGVAVWILYPANSKTIEEIARIPLEDEDNHG